MLILDIFFSFFKIGLFSFGGGYVMLPLIEKEIIRGNAWLTYSQFVDIIAIAEMTPGPVAINLATFVGYRIAGIPGAIASTTGVIIPSFIIIVVLVKFLKRFYERPMVQHIFKGLRPSIIALVSIAFLMVAETSIYFEDLRSMGIATAAFLILVFTRVNPILVILGGGLVGFFLY